jgi:hypothetical protein
LSPATNVRPGKGKADEDEAADETGEAADEQGDLRVFGPKARRYALRPSSVTTRPATAASVVALRSSRSSFALTLGDWSDGA